MSQCICVYRYTQPQRLNNLKIVHIIREKGDRIHKNKFSFLIFRSVCKRYKCYKNTFIISIAIKLEAVRKMKKKYIRSHIREELKEIDFKYVPFCCREGNRKN